MRHFICLSTSPIAPSLHALGVHMAAREAALITPACLALKAFGTAALFAASGQAGHTARVQ